MRMMGRFKAWRLPARTWVALAVLAPIGILLASGLTLLELRRGAWREADQTARNLMQVIDRDIERNIEIIDLSLQATVDNFAAPGAMQVQPDLRQRMLFDRAATARDIGVMLILDEYGNSVFDSAGFPPRKVNNADREYFQYHKNSKDAGLHISDLIVSKLTGYQIIVLSRRISKPDGSFGGVALASLRIDYFRRLFDNLALGSKGAINLYGSNGVRLMRYPYDAADIGVNLSGASNFQRFVREGRGSFVAVGVRDGVERLFNFTQVGALPLVLNVALATEEIDAAWRVKGFFVAVLITFLCGMTIALSLLFNRQLRRSAEYQAAFAKLSDTDALTGLANRRHFDREFGRALDTDARGGRNLSLLIVDADHFKRVNDRYGHLVGDEVLKRLAGSLSASVHRPGDRVFRLGGEEFAVLLPETDAAGARIVAEKIHRQVSSISVAHSGIDRGSVTVSIGVATMDARIDGRSTTEDLYRRADAALYQAKEAGRSRTSFHAAGSLILNDAVSRLSA